jgi:esterase/lipase superfamily enzyme
MRAVGATSAVKKSKYMQVPIFYLTDRKREKNAFGSARRYIVNCQHNMYYGLAYFSVPNRRSNITPKMEQQLGWKETNQKQAKISPKDFIEDINPAKEKTEFFDQLAQALDRSGSDKLCIFVHGAEDSFDDASTDAAELSYYLGRPLVIYSWPSVPKLLGYVIDNGNNEWSQAHFDMFLCDLQSFKEKHPIDICLISHSMGNRLVIRSTQFLYANKLIKDFELISPDIDLGVCQHYLLGLTDHAARIRLYFSCKDKMLALSQWLFGGYYRLGQGMGGIISKQNSGDPSVPAKITIHGESSGQEAIPDDNIEQIDFTCVDKGFRGHSIPFELIADMINGNKPGHGLKFCDMNSEKDARLASGIMSWQLDKSDSALLGTFKRVVIQKP